jgi:RNA polymerase sigma-70 factor (ECF subfamily)
MLSKEEFKVVYNDNFEIIRNFIFYHCGDSEMASDMAQDVFMKIWEKQEKLDNSRLKPLLYKMAKGLYIDDHRKKQLHVGYENYMKLVNEMDLSPEEGIIFNELKVAFAKALEQLPYTQRAVYLMSREDGTKYAEIAKIFEISVKTVDKYISSTVQFLKKQLVKYK